MDIATILASLYGKKLKPDIVNRYRSGDIRHCFADISKIKELGFQPSVSIDAGMKELVDWGKTQHAEDRGEKACNELKERGLVED